MSSSWQSLCITYYAAHKYRSKKINVFLKMTISGVERLILCTGSKSQTVTAQTLSVKSVVYLVCGLNMAELISMCCR